MFSALLVLNFTLQDNLQELSSQVTNPGYMGNLLIMAIFLAIIALYIFLFDKHTIVQNLFALYIAFGVLNFWPNDIWLEWMENWWAKLILLGVVYLLILSLLGAGRFFKKNYAKGFFSRVWQGVISGFLFAGFLCSILLLILPVSFLSQFSPSLLKLFISDLAQFIWFVAPLLGLFFIRAKRRGPGRPM